MNFTSLRTWDEAKKQAVGEKVLRYGIALVFIWFGSQQLMDPAGWVRLVPEWATLGIMEKTTFVLINGVFEVVAAIILFIGFRVRIVATLLALHLFSIALSFGLSPTGVRDFGLTFAAAALAFMGKSR